jgi:crotonobetainyl-CoA:carnitine CoA-transferase CaiB-like acyl-CoA transferase
VRTFQDVTEHQQPAARQMFPTVDHAMAGPHQVTGPPVKLSETPGRTGAPAPLLGEHTFEALQELLGLDADSLNALVARGVIFEERARGA